MGAFSDILSVADALQQEKQGVKLDAKDAASKLRRALTDDTFVSFIKWANSDPNGFLGTQLVSRAEYNNTPAPDVPQPPPPKKSPQPDDTQSDDETTDENADDTDAVVDDVVNEQ